MFEWHPHGLERLRRVLLLLQQLGEAGTTLERRPGGGRASARVGDGLRGDLRGIDGAAVDGRERCAAGVHEAIYTILMMNNDFMAESANIHELVDEAEGMNILTKRKDGPFQRAMSNSFGFGGTNCALVFDKYVE